MLFSSRIKQSFINVLLTTLMCGTIAPTLVQADTKGEINAAANLIQGKEGISENALKFLKAHATPCNTALFVAALTTFMYIICKPASNEPARISWTEVKDMLANPKQLIADLKNDFKGTMTKFWHAIDDLVIGRVYTSSGAKADKDTGRVYVKNISSKPIGILGKILSYRKYIARGICNGVGLTMLLDGEFRAGLKDLKVENLSALLMVLGLAEVIP